MRSLIIYVLAAAAAFYIMGSHDMVSADSTDEFDAMRCGNQLVTLGDQQFIVAQICGDPDRIQVESYGREIWIYNFGPDEFIRYLTFVNGRLQRIQLGDKGW